MKKIIYITGALGFMASYFVRSCLLRGYYVIGIDKIDIVSNLKLLKEFETYSNFKFIKQDINDISELYDCDYLVNFAASSHVDRSLNSSKQFVHDNIEGVYHLLEVVRQKNPENRPILIHISTDETYGDIVNGSHSETDILKPSNPYSASKASGDMLIIAWARTYGVTYVIARPTNNYGNFQYPEKLIPKTCKYLQLERKIPLHNNGTPRRIWLHAQDTASAILTIIDKKKVNEIYNISGNCELSNIDVVKRIIHLYHNISIENISIEKYCDFSYNRIGQDVRYNLDDSKLKALGWKPVMNFDEELPSIVNFYKDNFIW